MFISHAADDSAVAAALTRDLRKAGFEVWPDADSLAPGDNWALALGQALERAEAMVVLLSPDSVSSEWFKRELEYVLTSRRFRGRLVPVMIRKTADVPWILRKLSFIDATTDRGGLGRRVVEALKRGDAAA